MKFLKYTLITTITIFSFLTSYEAKKETVSLAKCVDGDTARLIYKGEEIRARFLAVDTPESVHPTKEVEAYGKNASEYTCHLLTNAEKIQIEYDPDSDETDKYNRHLVWIFVDGELLQDKLVSVGYASVKYIYGDYKYTDILYASEEEAKNNKLGIWNEEQPVEEEKEDEKNNSKPEVTTFDINGIEVNISNDKKYIIIALTILGAILAAAGSKIKIKRKKK